MTCNIMPRCSNVSNVVSKSASKFLLCVKVIAFGLLSVVTTSDDHQALRNFNLGFNLKSCLAGSVLL